MKKVMIVLGMISLLSLTLEGCRKKSEEEQIGELLGKLDKAQRAGNEKESQRINKKIKELIEKQKKREEENIRKVEAKIGKPIVYKKWMGYGSRRKLRTMFSVTFDQIFVSKRVPWDGILVKKKDTKYLIIYARVENLGPREGIPSFSGNPEVKVANGSVYDAYVSLYRKMGYAVPNLFDSKGWDSISSMESLKVGEKAWWAIFSIIPKDATPVEFFGELGRDEFMVKFRLKLN